MMLIATTKSKIIYSDLKRKILSGKLKPDTRLVIRQLAESYNSSDIPVREALTELAADDLIEMSPHKGSRVKKLSLKEMKDMLEVRTALEPLAASLAAGNSTPGLVNELRELVVKCRKLAAEKDYTAYSNVNREFHRLIVDASDNVYLKRILSELLQNGQRTKTVFELFPEVVDASLAEHEEMVLLMEQKKCPEMHALMLKHKSRSYDKLHDYFSKLIDDSSQESESN